MKSFLIIIASLLFAVAAIGQNDTLFTRKQHKIICKIHEINSSEIKYSLAGGPTFIIDRGDVLKYTLSNGFSEFITRDELSIENEHMEIINNRSVIKISPFSMVNNQVGVSYEKVIKVGMNLDFEFGYINNDINRSSVLGPQFYNMNNKPVHYSGAYFKPGMKFFLGHDYAVKGLRYAHPLKGRYLRLDFAVSYLNFQDVARSRMSSGQTQQQIKTDISTIAYGGFVNFGRQFILGNTFTVEYYCGFGFTAQSDRYSNPEFLTYFGYYNDIARIGNYHGFMRVPYLGLSGTAGFRVGYIIPDKTVKKDRSLK
jgi:hypothetical protein